MLGRLSRALTSAVTFFLSPLARFASEQSGSHDWPAVIEADLRLFMAAVHSESRRNGDPQIVANAARREPLDFVVPRDG